MSAALEHPKIADGPAVAEFERAVAAAVTKREGAATSSGTAALHLALLAVGAGPGDLVLLPSLTFVAPANAACYAQALPFLFDAEPEYRQLDVDRFASWLDAQCEMTRIGAVHKASGRRVGAVVAVDLLGHPCDVETIARLTEPLGIPLIEDGAQALGATHRSRPIGTHAEVLCLSFNANKIVTSGGGGMVLSDDASLLSRIRTLADQAKVDGKAYVHDRIGFNYRLASAQAALGLSQLARLGELVGHKRRIADRYRANLADVPGLELPRTSPEAAPTAWLSSVHVDADEFGLPADRLRAALLERAGVETRPMFSPLHEAGVHLGREAHQCPVAERLGATGVMLPSSVALADEDVDRVCDALVDLRP